MATKAEKAAEVAEAVERLRELAPAGSTVYGIVRQVSRSGMSRQIDFYAIEGGRFWYLTGTIARALGQRFSRNDRGLRVRGCGMDMVFATVYSAAQAAHGDGYAWKAETL